MDFIEKVECRSFTTQWGTYDFANNKAFYSSLLFYPYVDSYLVSEGIIKQPVWKDGKPFAVALTHDVETVNRFGLFEKIRILERIGIPNDRNDLMPFLSSIYRLPINLLKQIVRENDPFNNFERWLEIEDKYNAKSTFFFMPLVNEKIHRQWDCSYSLIDKISFDGKKITVFDLIGILNKRGWEIGLHSSIYSYNDLELLKKGGKIIEEALGEKITSVRQHYLMFDRDETPFLHKKAGFKYDTTYGFNRTVGFRAGTSYPFLFDTDSVLEIPLIIQDIALFGKESSLGLNKKRAIELCLDIVKRVQRVGGVLTISWHPHYWNEGFEDWIYVYKELLRVLNEEGAWITTLKDIGIYWEEHYKENMENYIDRIDIDKIFERFCTI